MDRVTVKKLKLLTWNWKERKQRPNYHDNSSFDKISNMSKNFYTTFTGYIWAYLHQDTLLEEAGFSKTNLIQRKELFMSTNFLDNSKANFAKKRCYQPVANPRFETRGGVDLCEEEKNIEWQPNAVSKDFKWKIRLKIIYLLKLQLGTVLRIAA